MPISEDFQRLLSSAHQEALRVGDSPLRADRLAARLADMARQVPELDTTDEIRSRLRAALADAERVLRRDDDGHRAATHLQTAVRLAEDRPRRPPPF